MIQAFCQRTLQRLGCLLMALHLLCLSIDAPDAWLLANGVEDTRVNDIESLYELLTESVLGHDVPEQDEPDDESRLTKAPNFEYTLPVSPSLSSLVWLRLLASSGWADAPRAYPRPAAGIIPPPLKLG